jgi:hypothetical protein
LRSGAVQHGFGLVQLRSAGVGRRTFPAAAGCRCLVEVLLVPFCCSLVDTGGGCYGKAARILSQPLAMAGL